jgi:hypothetical protein
LAKVDLQILTALPDGTDAAVFGFAHGSVATEPMLILKG